MATNHQLCPHHYHDVEQAVLGERVVLSRASTNVQLTITSLCLKVKTSEIFSIF